MRCPWELMEPRTLSLVALWASDSLNGGGTSFAEALRCTENQGPGAAPREEKDPPNW